MKILRYCLIPALVLVPLTILHGHEFWLGASQWKTRPGSTVTLTADVGDNTFPVSQSFTQPDRVESVRVIGPGAQPITPKFHQLGESLATEVTLPLTPATYVIVMSVKGRLLSMPADQFAEYLKEEGLDGVLAERARRGESNQPSRERYARQAKILVHAGDGPPDHVTQPTGLVAELVPESDFTRARAEDTITVRLIFHGDPVKDAQISLTAASAATPKEARVTLARTDASGRAQFKLIGNGPYLLNTVVMVRREGETGSQAADWESYWCSLTFNISDGRLTPAK